MYSQDGYNLFFFFFFEIKLKMYYFDDFFNDLKIKKKTTLCAERDKNNGIVKCNKSKYIWKKNNISFFGV
jgi:hypothetical protein